MNTKELTEALNNVPNHPVTLGEAEELEVLIGATFSKLQAGEVESEVRALLGLVTVLGRRVIPDLTLDDVREVSIADIEPIAERLGDIMEGKTVNPT